MNISTLTFPQEEAREKYRELLASTIVTPLNRTRKRVYYSISKGRKVIDIYTAFEQAGLNELGQPRIAVCRADAEKCYFHPRTRRDSNFNREATGGGTFTLLDTSWRLESRNKKEPIRVPDGSYAHLTTKTLSTSVPQIPQEYMPKGALKNYFILWEVEHWTEEIPRDPLLLRRLSYNLFEILSEWELSELEWSIARGAF